MATHIVDRWQFSGSGTLTLISGDTYIPQNYTPGDWNGSNQHDVIFILSGVTYPPIEEESAYSITDAWGNLLDAIGACYCGLFPTTTTPPPTTTPSPTPPSLRRNLLFNREFSGTTLYDYYLN